MVVQRVLGHRRQTAPEVRHHHAGPDRSTDL